MKEEVVMRIEKIWNEIKDLKKQNCKKTKWWRK